MLNILLISCISLEKNMCSPFFEGELVLVAKWYLHSHNKKLVNFDMAQIIIKRSSHHSKFIEISKVVFTISTKSYTKPINNWFSECGEIKDIFVSKVAIWATMRVLSQTRRRNSLRPARVIFASLTLKCMVVKIFWGKGEIYWAYRCRRLMLTLALLNWDCN